MATMASRSAQAFPSRHRARAWRHAPLAIRRDLRGDVPDAGLRLSRRGSCRGALQGRGSGLRLFALRQSDRLHVRGAHVPARRRRGEPRHGERHGGRDGFASLRPEGGRPRRLLARAVRLVRLRHRRFPAAPRHRLDAGRRHRPRRLGRKAVRPETTRLLPGKPLQPDARADRHRRASRRSRAQAGRAARRRQRLLHAALPAAARAWRAYRRLFRHQAHRRPGPLPRRHRALRRGVGGGEALPLSEAHRPLAQPLQRLGAPEGAGDAGGAGDAPGGDRRRSSPACSPATRPSSGSTIPGHPSHPQFALAQPPDDVRRHDDLLRCAGRKARRLRFPPRARRW